MERKTKFRGRSREGGSAMLRSRRVVANANQHRGAEGFGLVV